MTWPVRSALVWLIGASTFVGTWALAAPASFYGTFPGSGFAWVSVDGPFNEHLIRDVGALNLALGAVALIAILRPERWLLVATGAAFLVFGVPHLAYHLGHLEALDTSDQVLELASLGMGLLAAAYVAITGLRDHVEVASP